MGRLYQAEKPDNRVPNLQRRLYSVGARVPEQPKQAPGLLTRILDVLAAPGEAVAGIAKGIGPVEGIKQKTHFSDVLRDIGITGTPGAVLGFGLDVLLDPLNLITFGAGGMGVKAATKVGKLMLPAAERARLTERAVQIYGRRPTRLSDIMKTVARGGPKPLVSEETTAFLKELPGQAAPSGELQKAAARAQINRMREARRLAKQPDLGGLKIAGKTVIPGATLAAPFKAAAASRPVQAALQTPVGQSAVTLTEALQHLFSPKKAAQAASRKMAQAVTGHAEELRQLRRGTVPKEIPDDYAQQVASVLQGALGTAKTATEIENIIKGGLKKLEKAKGKYVPGKAIVAETKVPDPLRAAREIIEEHARRRGIAQRETQKYLKGIQTIFSGIGPEDRKKVLHILEDFAQLKPMKGLSPEDAARMEEISAQIRQMEENVARELARAVRQVYAEVPNLADEIRRRGGIRIDKTKAFAKEFFESVPLQVRRLVGSKKGMPLDEMADELGMTADELIQSLAGGGAQAATKTAREGLDISKHIPQAIRYLEENDPAYRLARAQFIQLQDKALEEYVKGDEHLLPVVQTLQKLLRTMGQEELQRGLLASTIEKYAPHVRNPETRLTGQDVAKLAAHFGIPERKLTGLTSDNAQERLRAYATLFNPHAHERQIRATVKEINEVLGKEFFTEDAALAVSVRGVRAIQARQAYLFAQGALAKWGVPVTPETLRSMPVPPGFGAYRVAQDPATGRVILREITSNDLLQIQQAQLVREQLKARLGKDAPMPELDVPFMAVFPQDMARTLNSMSAVFFGDEDVQKMLRAYDNFLAWWRGTATVIRPGYHLRNATGNFWNNWLAGIKDPKWYTMAGSLQKNPDQVFNTPIGRLTGHDLLAIMQERNVVGTTFAGSELGKRAYSAIRERIGQGRLSWNPLSVEFAPVQLGKRVGVNIEENAKIAHFLAKLWEYGDPDAATVSVKKFLFDYGDLTEFERQVMKRIIPFWTWTRKNIPLQFEQFLKRPGRQAKAEDIQAAFYAATGEDRPTREQQPAWFQEQTFPVRIGKRGTREQYFNLLLPPADVSMIGTSAGTASGNLAQTLQNIFSMTTPAARAPVEFALNRQFFNYPQQIFYGPPTGPGEDIGRLGKFAASTVPPLRDIVNLIAPPAGRERELRDWLRLAGVSAIPVDREKVAAQREREYYDLLQAIRRRLESQGVEVPDIREIEKRKRGRLY